ncbi:TerB family tellurite resistance protein [Streptomyces sp. JJ38]|uniref:TerB family tellurite resistance protein n=1 Tax=Streptomyces sp. JJ38 TaxID=2738128 RepID=UPI0035B0C858
MSGLRVAGGCKGEAPAAGWGRLGTGLRTGVRTAWTTVADGEFFCASCGGDRNYERRTGRRRLELLGVPLLRRGVTAPVLACTSCGTHSGPEALERPTTTRLAALLRDGVECVALAVLATGGSDSEAVRRAAVDSVHAAGYPDCTEKRLLDLCTALRADTSAECGVGVEIELHATLGPLVPHLAEPGRVGLLLQGARIALADGPYVPAERAVLSALGSALDFTAEETQRLLAAAPERS